ncbi:hypothetical protein GCM10022238_25990 [Gordonia hankookensis]
MTPQDGRHLTMATLESLWSNEAPIEIPIAGEPPCSLQLNARNHVITLVTTYQRPEPDTARLMNLSFDAWTVDNDELAAISVNVEGNIHGAYGLLATIADEIQVNHAPLAVAVDTAVTRHRDVVAARGALDVNREIGLFGELLFLDFLIHAIGAGPAVDAWMGPISEEHDFVFDDVHIEVKTTSTERRRHVINGLGQLVPVGDTALSLLSVQLTRVTATAGRTLPQLVAAVRTAAGGHAVALDHRLESSGWLDEDAELYPTSWRLRTVPMAFPVGVDFPALTPDAVARVVPNSALVVDVSYMVDLTTLPSCSLPERLNGFVTKEESPE